MSDARRDDGIRQAVAARERGRSKVRSTTTAVTMASVVTAGALALALPGSTTRPAHPADPAPPRPTRAPPGPARAQAQAAAPARPAPAPAPPDQLRLQLRHQNSGSSSRQLQLELRRLQLRLRPGRKLGRRQPGHLGRLLMPHRATATDAEASASWRALGTLVQLVVTDPAALPEARRLLERRPRRGGRGLQPVPRRLRDPLATRRPAAGQPAAGRGRRGGAAGGQADRRRRGPDRRRGHVRGRVRP